MINLERPRCLLLQSAFPSLHLSNYRNAASGHLLLIPEKHTVYQLFLTHFREYCCCLLGMGTYCAIFNTNAVLPMEGRAAIRIKSGRLQTCHLIIRSTKPVAIYGAFAWMLFNLIQCIDYDL